MGSPRIAGSVVGLLTFLLLSFLSFAGIGHLIARDVAVQQGLLLSTVNDLTRQHDETLKSLAPLRAQTACTDDIIVEMRRQTFLRRDIPDIGFMFDGALLCTTGLGMLERPFVSTEEPDLILISGEQVFANTPIVLFDHTVYAFIVVDESFSVIIDTERLKGLEIPHIDFEVFVREIHAAEGRRSVAGVDNLRASVRTEAGGILGALGEIGCSDTGVWCVASRIGAREALGHYGPTIGAALVAVVALSVLAGALSIRYFRWLGSDRHRISRALRSGKGFYTVYQPIVEIKSGRVIGCEVLARYEDRYGTISPAVFIPLVTRWRKTWDFTCLVIDRSFRDLSLLYERYPAFRISINIFPEDIETDKFDRVLANHWIAEAARRNLAINFELIETQVADISLVRNAIERFRRLGFSIAIDDFGTGYSNLDQVRRIRAEYLKIDRSFVNDIEESSIRSSIVPHIVAMAESLGIEVIAEGIENPEQARILEELGVLFAQGYFFGRPMKRDDFYWTLLEPDGDRPPEKHPEGKSNGPASSLEQASALFSSSAPPGGLPDMLLSLPRRQ